MKRPTPVKKSTPVKTRRKSKKPVSEPVIIAAPKLEKKKKNIFGLYAKIALWLGIICFLVVINILVMRTFPVAKPVNFAASAKKIPAEIIIKDANIDLPVFPAVFANGTFETTSKGASYLTSTPISGDFGNSVIYAHNWPNLFGNLTKVQQGEKITIVFSNKTQKQFIVSKTETVSAYKTGILQSYEDTRLTIFTCTNFLDADRFVVTATPN